MRRSKVYQVSDEEFRQIIQQSYSFSDCLRYLGLTPRGGSSSDILKQRIEELHCDISHFHTQKQSVTAKYTLDEILVEHSSYRNIARLKERLVNEGRLEYRCACCGLTQWRDKPISLQLHHKNGQNNDHRIENLEFLCPNCHSQTDTFAGKNK